MKIKIERNGEKLILKSNKINDSADSLLKEKGYKYLKCLDIENHSDVKWEGIEFNRLFEKDNYVYRFNVWTDPYPSKELEIEKIGFLFS